MATATTKPKSSRPKLSESDKGRSVSEAAKDKPAAKDKGAKPAITEIKELAKKATAALKKVDRPIHSKEFCDPDSPAYAGMNEREQDRLYLYFLEESRQKDNAIVKIEGKATFDLREQNPKGWADRKDPKVIEAEEKARKAAEKAQKDAEKAQKDAEKAAAAQAKKDEAKAPKAKASKAKPATGSDGESIATGEDATTKKLRERMEAAARPETKRGAKPRRPQAASGKVVA